MVVAVSTGRRDGDNGPCGAAAVHAPTADGKQNARQEHYCVPVQSVRALHVTAASGATVILVGVIITTIVYNMMSTTTAASASRCPAAGPQVRCTECLTTIPRQLHCALIPCDTRNSTFLSRTFLRKTKKTDFSYHHMHLRCFFPKIFLSYPE